MVKIIDPWGSELPADYEETIKTFGLELFKPEYLPEPNRLMRRQVVFASRDLAKIKDAIINNKDYYVLTGIMPSAEKIHLGNKLVIENVAYFQKHNAKTYVLVADFEALSTRNISLEEARERALNFHIPAFLALGLDRKKTTFYFQSSNSKVINLAYEFSSKTTLNEFKGLYGLLTPGRILAALTQAADILFPQLGKTMPGIIPVGLDQDVHIRFTRDIAARFKSRYNFELPSSIYHKFTPSLLGLEKMSKSIPESFILLPEDIEDAKKKYMQVKTAGRETAALQRKLGGVPEKCVKFEIDKQHLIEDDKELEEIYHDCKAGNILCHECKLKSCKYLEEFLKNFNKKLEKERKNINRINLISDFNG